MGFSDVTADQLEAFAKAFGISGKIIPGDGEAITSEWALIITPKDAEVIISVAKFLNFEIEDQRIEDGYVQIHTPEFLVCLSYDNFVEGDCILTI